MYDEYEYDVTIDGTSDHLTLMMADGTTIECVVHQINILDDLEF